MGLLFVLSIFSGLISTAIYNLGFAFEKKAISTIELEKKISLKDLLLVILTNPLWIFGLFLTIASVGFYFISLLWAPLSAIAPLAGFGLIILVIYAHFDLKESFKKLEILSFSFILVGISISSYLISLTAINYDWNTWESAITSVGGIIFICSLVVIAFIPLIVMALSKRKKLMVYLLATLTGIVAGIQSLLIKGVTVLITDKKWSEILSLVIYVLLILFTALVSTGGLQFAFNKGRVSIIMAIYNSFMTIIPILFGGIILKEWSELSLILKLILVFSIIITLAGVLILSLKHAYSFEESNL
ncbi:MAG: DMT family transporter [Candidatus Heimdallarchaeaceae archaeon]